MNFSKIMTLLVTIISTNSYAADYTQGNSNPFKQYSHNSEAFKAQNIQSSSNNRSNNVNSVNFSSNIQSPLTVKQSIKYKNLVNNASNLHGCWDKAGKAYNIDPWLLLSIAKVESGFNNKAMNVNTNKSVDIGMMQINTIWLPTLRKFGITHQHLMDPCTSVFVGAWIAAQNIRRFGYNQDGIGAYNSPGNVVIRRNYAKKVYLAYNELVNDFSQQINSRR